MVSRITIGIWVVLIFAFFAVLILSLVYGFTTSIKPAPPPTIYPYGPTMYFARTTFPLPLNSAGQLRIFPGLEPVPPGSFTNAPGTTLFNPADNYIDSSSSSIIFSSSAWYAKAFYKDLLWQNPPGQVIYGKLPISNGLFWLTCDFDNNTGAAYINNLYYYDYTVPYAGFLNPASFAGNVNGCFTSNNYHDLGYSYREPAVLPQFVNTFFAPVLNSTLNIPPGIHNPAFPALPTNVTFSIAFESGSDFTSTFIYKDNNASPGTHYMTVTMSKLIPYIVVTFVGSIFVNAHTATTFFNQGFEANPDAKVFNFYDGNGYQQPADFIDQSNVTQFTMSDGATTSTYFSLSNAVTLSTRNSQSAPAFPEN